MKLRYLEGYPPHILTQTKALIETQKLAAYLMHKYPTLHPYNSDKALFEYTQEIKEQYLKKSLPLSKVVYDGKINVLKDALGMHTYISRVQGGKLKSKNEIHIASLFKNVPEPFLRMIVVHEVAHIKEKAHDKAFYKLCTYMEPAYHQLELDVRLFLTCKELGMPISFTCKD